MTTVEPDDGGINTTVDRVKHYPRGDKAFTKFCSVLAAMQANDAATYVNDLVPIADCKILLIKGQKVPNYQAHLPDGRRQFSRLSARRIPRSVHRGIAGGGEL